MMEHTGKGIAMGLRMLETSFRAWGRDQRIVHEQAREAVRVLGPAEVIAINNLQSLGLLPDFTDPKWDELLELADSGQVRVVPVFLVGDDYVCEPIVEEKIRGKAAPVPPPAGRARKASAHPSLASEIASWG